MKRREFIAASAVLLVSPWRSWAQGTPRRIGYLDPFLNFPLYKVWLDFQLPTFPAAPISAPSSISVSLESPR
ncbi:hypothetical protein Q2941_40765, partial [Bradyrhizobium sp. UFLA05-153]